MGWFMLIVSSIWIILTAIIYVSEQEFGFFTFLGAILIPLFFLVTGIIGIFSATKRVEVYRGFVVYHKGFTKKEYPISDIKTSKSQTETYSVGYYEDRVAATGHDSVTIFYDKNGKPIFKFGLAYENVERLKDDVKKARGKFTIGKEVFECLDFSIEILALLLFLVDSFLVYTDLQ